jgi:glycosyltransferase involved in cell wall biosynthesis
MLSGARWIALRAMGTLIERRGDVTHLFGGLSSWHLLRSLGRRPLVFTVAIHGGKLPPAMLDRVCVFTAESERLAAQLVTAGVPPERIQLIYPGVDLTQYRPVVSSSRAPFRVLFASAPANRREFHDRGITLLVEVARLRPQTNFALLWREWGDQSEALAAFNSLRPPKNIFIEYRDGRDMPSIYQSSDAVACLYADGFGKSCPNSVVEGLASGLPALVSDTCDIGHLVETSGAGVAVARTPQEVASALDAIQANHEAFRGGARALAERVFDLEGFVEKYRQVYLTVADRRASGTRDTLRGESAGGQRRGVS